MLSAPLSLELEAEALARVQSIYVLALDDVGGVQELECARGGRNRTRLFLLSAEVVAMILVTLRFVTKNESLQPRPHKALHPPHCSTRMMSLKAD